MAVAPAWAARPIPEQRAYVQGDSVMVGAEADVDADLKSVGWTGTVTGFVGLHTYAAVPLFVQVRSTMGSVAVIELGANDCCEAPNFSFEIDQTMHALSGLHVIWLTIPDFAPGAAGMNAALEAAATRWPNLQIAGWGAFVAAHPGMTWGDGLHLRPAGSQLLASFIRTTLDAWYAPWGGPDRTYIDGLGAAPRLAGVGGGVAAGGVPTAGGVIGGGATPSGNGYWVVDTRGGVYTFGDAPFYGSLGATRISSPIVGLAPTPDGRGYWLVGAGGGVFSFGDAAYYGSLGGTRVSSPIVGLAPTPDGRGYWLVGAGGGVFSFGDAGFHGSLGGTRLAAPVVGMAAAPGGSGYWLVSAGGGVFSFGDAGFYGSAAPDHPAAPVQAVAATPDGRGYWLVGSDGGVFSFGDAGFSGRAVAAAAPAAYYSDILARPGGGYWLIGSVTGTGLPAIGAQAPSVTTPPPTVPAASRTARRPLHHATPAPGHHERSFPWFDLAWILPLAVVAGGGAAVLLSPRARAHRARRRRGLHFAANADGPGGVRGR